MFEHHVGTLNALIGVLKALYVKVYLYNTVQRQSNSMRFTEDSKGRRDKMWKEAK